MKNYCLIFILVFSFTRCTEVPQSDHHEIAIEFTPDSDIPSDIISKTEYIPLETNEECVIGNISKMTVQNGRIYILDERSSMGLFVFDSTGHYLFKIQRIGKGPGESELNDFTLYGDKIILLAYKSALFFDLRGNYLYTKDLKHTAVNILIKNNDEVYLFQNNDLGRDDFARHHVIKTNLEFKNYIEYFSRIKQEYHNLYRFQKFGDLILMSAPITYSNEIYDISDNNYHKFMKFNFIGMNIPEEFPEYSIHSSKEVEYPYLSKTIFQEDFIFFVSV